jgi:hypothetical protein
MCYVKETYRDMVYSKENQYSVFTFRVMLNGREYLIGYNKRSFEWVNLPEEITVDVEVKRDISSTFFQYPEGAYSTSIWKKGWIRMPKPKKARRHARKT